MRESSGFKDLNQRNSMYEQDFFLKKVTDQVVVDVMTAIIHKIPMTMNFLKSGRRSVN